MSILRYLAFRQYSNADAYWLMFVGYLALSGRWLWALGLTIICAVISVVFEAAVAVWTEEDA